MRAMIMAAGLGTRLRPLTYEVPKPLVPVANRPVIEHLLRLLARHEVGEAIANLHWFADAVEAIAGDGRAQGVELSYRREPELLGTAGGVRNVADFLIADGESFVVMAGDALTDIDLRALVAAHERHGGVATLATKRVANVAEYGVVVTGADGRIQGFQEKPDPAEALSDQASCMIYAFRPEIFDYFPDRADPDWAKDVFPILLDGDVPFFAHSIDGYWNDVGTIAEYVQGNLDAVSDAVDVELGGKLVDGGEPPEAGDEEGTFGRVLVGDGARISSGARLEGPLVIGPGATVGAGAVVRESVLLPGAELAPASLTVGAVCGRRGLVAGGGAAPAPDSAAARAGSDRGR